MRMKTILLSFIIFFTTMANTQAQERIENPLYELFLKGFLSHSVQQVSADSLREVRNEMVLLDTREKREYEVSHIADAIHIGYEEADFNWLENLPRDTSIVVYCSVGYRSEKIGEQLLEMGFIEVLNLYGGIFEWKNQGYPVVDEQGETEKIHAYSGVWGVWLNKGEKVYR